MTEPGEDVRIEVTVNGKTYRRTVEARMTASDFLRDVLQLTGTHVGCEHGVCGACTVLIDGRSVRSCIAFAGQLDGATVETVEGLAGPEGLHPLQEAFRQCHALQCGFCTPGFLMVAQEYLREVRDPGEEEIRDALSGNICRCTGYQSIVDAVQLADRTWQR
ncbi:(2Fe-2S)-binding protein [Blastococcus brunescens]|uniref:(2Fe-2S)-binding protein n=1 Tax=Blastococcus brunescens TaxID=1564165 RepID=A0ABZ1AYK7_9ACTN|nr:(2Fe-2S)-binding protein [Blastococcus sp. BMG 8361]WRL63554.1 (2Fe-2S)-binding protein [Blastococcus sp. BMG 8361]